MTALLSASTLLQVEDATDYMNQQMSDAQKSMEEAKQSLEQYQKVRRGRL